LFQGQIGFDNENLTVLAERSEQIFFGSGNPVLFIYPVSDQSEEGFATKERGGGGGGSYMHSYLNIVASERGL